MSVTSVTTGTGAGLEATQQAAIVKLAQSLQSGDLTGARSAYATLARTVPQGGGGQIQKSFQALGQALQSGDLSAAKSAFASLAQAAGATKTTAANAGQAGGGGDGGGGGGGGAAAKTETGESTTVLPSGAIITTITYSDGTVETTVSYGPPPKSTQSVIA